MTTMIIGLGVTIGLPLLSVLMLLAFTRWDDRRHRRMIGRQWDAFCEGQRREWDAWMDARARALEHR